MTGMTLKSLRYLFGSALLGAALTTASTSVGAAGSERIFTHGFEPCCQIGGTVSGLAGSGLVLQLNADGGQESHPVTGNGPYQFATSVAPGTNYTLTVGNQPNAHTCAFSTNGGSMGDMTIDNLDVACTGNLTWDNGNWSETWN